MMALGVALAAMTFNGQALADEASAGEAFRAGKASYAREEYRAAALSFEAAFREAPHGAALYNAAQSWLAAGVRPRAADDYDAALRKGGLDAAQDADARSHLTELQATLGIVTVHAPGGTVVSLAHVEKGTPPLDIHVTPGSYTVLATLADGTNQEKQVEISAGTRRSVSFEPPPPRVAASSRPEAPPPRTSLSLVFGAASLGGAVLSGVSVAVFGVNALKERNAFNESGFTDGAARARAVEYQAWSNGMLVAAGALGALGAVLLVTSRRSESRAALLLSPGQAALSVTF